MSALDKIRDLQNQQIALEKQIHEIAKNSLKVATEILKTDKFEFFSEQEYDDNDYFTASGVETIAGISVRSFTWTYTGLEDLVEKFLNCKKSEESADEFEELSQHEDFLRYLKKNKISYEESMQALEVLNSLPDSLMSKIRLHR